METGRSPNTRQLRAMLETLDVAFWAVTAGGRISYCSQRAAAIQRSTPAAVVGRPASELVRDRALPRAGDGPVSAVLVGAGGRAVGATLESLPLGTGLLVRVIDHPAPQEDGCLAAVKQTEERLAETQRLAHVGSWEVDFASGSTFWSDETFRILGYEPGDIEPSDATWLACVAPSDRPAMAALMAHMDAGPAAFDRALRIITPRGARRWVRVRATANVADGKRVLTGTIQDETTRRGFDDALAFRASHDDVTGLPNRSWVVDRLQAAAPGQRYAVMVADVDDLELVNNGFGHTAGDVVLLEVATRLKHALREGDDVARFGGDEFAVVCADVHDSEDARELARRLAAAVSLPVELSGHSVHPSISIGIAFMDVGPAQRAIDVLREASVAMQAAKRRGRGQVELSQSADWSAAVLQLDMVGELREAIEADVLRVFYQPQVSLVDGALVGMEALARWPHPVRGFVPPSTFIPLAERCGLIGALGAHVLRTAVAQMAAWHREVPGMAAVELSVNVSACQLGDPSFPALVLHALDTSALAPDKLTLEITESMLMADPESSRRVLNELRQIGVGVSVDDFGTGYSSLAYLRKLPVDTLKIDRSFVTGIDHDGANRSITAAVTGLAHGLQLLAVAEGVERPTELAELRALGCDVGQGFYFSVPLAAEDVVGWVGRRRQPTTTVATNPPRRVLVADDSPEHRTMFRRILERTGHFVVVAEAGDGHDAVELAGRFQPDAVLMDVRMPVLGGIEALPAIHAAAPSARVVLISGASTRASCVDDDSGVVVLRKDVSSADLAAALGASAA